MSALQHRRATGLPLLLPLLVLAISACGAGVPETYRPRDMGDATNATLNDLALRAVSVAPPRAAQTYLAGADAPLRFTIVNTGRASDVLTAVRSTATTSTGLLEGLRPMDAIMIAGGGATTEASAVLRGLTTPLRPGSFVTVTFVFRSSGSLDVLVPVAVGNSPAPRAPAPTPKGEPAA